jgi:hypothetical protein
MCCVRNHQRHMWILSFSLDALEIITSLDAANTFYINTYFLVSFHTISHQDAERKKSNEMHRQSGYLSRKGNGRHMNVGNQQHGLSVE